MHFQYFACMAEKSEGNSNRISDASISYLPIAMSNTASQGLTSCALTSVPTHMSLLTIRGTPISHAVHLLKHTLAHVLNM